jgi:peptide-methionine (S)-S-oxide reductase
MRKLYDVILLLVFVISVCGLARAFAAENKTEAAHTQTLIVAGGCFWGMEAVFEHVKGVSQVVSGYAGGAADTAHYDRVSQGNTGHAESVKITYDPNLVSMDTLLDVYFTVAHNPTELNHQGPDSGTQYRSAIFIEQPSQQKIADAKIAQLTKAKKFSDPIVTKLEVGQTFYPAESYHQDYLAANMTQPYIVFHDLPKLAKLKETFPDLYKP